jgi:hypothetical protein
LEESRSKCGPHTCAATNPTNFAVAQDNVAMFYRPNIMAQNNRVVTAPFSGGPHGWNIQFYDVASAAVSPYESSNGETGYQTYQQSDLQFPMSYRVTPSTNNSLVISSNVWDGNTSAGLLGQLTDTCIASGMSQDGPYPIDQNNGWAHGFFTSTAAISLTWLQLFAQSRGAATYGAMSAVFKLDSGLPPPRIRLPHR